MKQPPNTGIRRIEAAFLAAGKRKRAALMPYFTLGYPTISESAEIISTIAPISDLMELGVPFSDPIADGPTIQHSSQLALENGITVSLCLDLVKSIRSQSIDVPILLMSYYNPILAYGEERFCKDAHQAGVDGLLVPDLPPEESYNLSQQLQRLGLALIHFLAPSSSSRRIAAVTSVAQGFIYMVSVTGVTGARKTLDSRLAAYVKMARERANLPVAVGFGISNPEQARAVGDIADGVIIGSKLIDVVDSSDDKPSAALNMLTAVNQALLLT